MNIEAFEITDIETFEISFLKRDFLRHYHQQVANLDQTHQNIEFFFGENNKLHQICNAYLHHETTVEKDEASQAEPTLIHGDTIRLVNFAFAYCFKLAKFLTTGDGNIEHNSYVAQVSTIMRALTSKDGDLISQFDENDETETERKNTVRKHLLVNNHEMAADKGRIKGELP